MSKYKSEKPKAAIKYGQSRDTGNFGHTRNRTRTTQTAKNMTNTDLTKQPGVNTAAREGYAIPVFCMKPTAFHSVKSVKSRK